MKVSQSEKRNRWVTISVILMLIALLSFSILPIVGGIAQGSQNSSNASTAFNPNSSALETKASGYQLVLEREPDNQNALKGLLEVRLQQGNLKDAIATLEKLAQLNPQQTEYAILIAQAKQQVGDYEGSITAYRTILASQPRDIQALKGITDLFLTQNRGTEAVSLVQKTIAEATKAKSTQNNPFITTDITSLQLLLAEIYLEQDRNTDALAIYEQAIKSDDKDFRPVLAKALILQKQGKDTEAKPIFDDAVSLAPVELKDRIKKMALKISETNS